MTDYEYELAGDGRVIMVRVVKDGKPQRWRVYMSCDTEAEAERVLFLLQHPEFEGGVRP